jgi:hypothetical protein
MLFSLKEVKPGLKAAFWSAVGAVIIAPMVQKAVAFGRSKLKV